MNINAGMTAGAKISPTQLLNMAVDGLSLLAEHENHSFANLWNAAKARAAVAKKARGLGELLRDQFDLLPDTLASVQRDHQLRLALLEGLGRDLRSTVAKRA